MRPSKTELFIIAMKARGYSERTVDSDMAIYRCLSISPSHARRIVGHPKDSTNRLWISMQGNVRHGKSYQMGKAIPRYQIQGHQLDGLKIWERTMRSKPKAKPAKLRVLTGKDLTKYLRDHPDDQG